MPRRLLTRSAAVAVSLLLLATGLAAAQGTEDAPLAVSFTAPSSIKISKLLASGIQGRLAINKPGGVGLVLAVDAKTSKRLKLGNKRTTLALLEGGVTRCEHLPIRAQGQEEVRGRTQEGDGGQGRPRPRRADRSRRGGPR